MADYRLEVELKVRATPQHEKGIKETNQRTFTAKKMMIASLGDDKTKIPRRINRTVQRFAQNLED